MRVPSSVFLVLTFIVTVLTVGTASSATVVTFETHNLRVSLDVPSQQATMLDSGMAAFGEGWNLLYVNAGAKIDKFTVDGAPVDYHVLAAADTSQLPADIKAGLPDLDLANEPLLVFFESPKAASVPFVMAYVAIFADPVENVQFSREKVGNEVRGTIGEQGAYLSPASFFYPSGSENLLEFVVTIDIPGEWLSVSDGNPMSSFLNGNRRLETFENPYVVDGLTVMAAPYIATVQTEGDVEVAAYFFEADTALAAGYVEAAAKYLRMYSELIGPYPYKRFTIAENFFPTGYGFPGWTLLGQQVLRLPFIKSTSLGHEVLHNWWGNSVYVDYDKGNWCEGLTVYGADYRYKLMESPIAARDYRKDILKEYASYVNSGNDFPIRKFTSRTSAETRTIGYNKTMMMFHMIEERIGTQAFFDAWKLVYSHYIAKQVSWEDWVVAFEQTGGADLSWVIPEWIDRAGAPTLMLGAVQKAAASGQTRVTLDLRQDPDRTFNMRVPVRFIGEVAVIDTFIVFNGPGGEYEFALSADVHTVEIDPDYHLFRRLYPGEIEPIISGVMGTPRKRIVAPALEEVGRSLYQSFGNSLTEEENPVESRAVLDESAKDFAPIVLNPSELPVELAAAMTVTDSTLIINGTSYPRAGHTFVMAGSNWNGFEKYMIVLSDDFQSLPRIGQLVPHYGKYSYLVFDGPRNVGKGQWPAVSSPLRKEL
ncbi:MAG: M1 family aminopeptidase [Candidatus Zixiibacteriota bacterium]